ncbi:MAG TPA: HAMP domain-containing sensor histidine kinase [Kineosporiaceae bacterium]|nr:HAMP domain-containing sensor histidine kinase [Kineosporiaceae bacterium]
MAERDPGARPERMLRRLVPWPLDVRARVLATVLTLTAIGMATTGTITLLAEQSQYRQHVDGTLEADIKEFRALAAARTQSDGTPITDVRSLMRTALQRQLASQGESFLALIGRKELYPPERTFELERLRPVMDAARATDPEAQVRIQEVNTTLGPVRFAVVPARVVGDPQVGLFVVGLQLRPGQQQILANARLYALVSGGCLGLVGVVGWLVAGRLLRPLRLLRDAARHISHSDLSLRIPVTGHDDVTELTRTVNEMLDRLQSAFETQQAFLDDAGHELRTPLTIVRGHLELLDGSDPREVGDVKALLLDELDRMGRLVDDLLVLAKARRPDFVRLAPLDLDRLVDEIADKALALGPRRWTVDGRPGLCIVADAQRLTQAVLQLADNAVRHTGPGDEIGIGAALDDDAQVRLWVRDTGCGVRTEDAHRIFERFGRASTGRGDDGSGLGLAIVSAIAAAHGGRVSLDSVLGQGATFTLVLPTRTLPVAEPSGPPDPDPGPFDGTLPPGPATRAGSVTSSSTSPLTAVPEVGP